MPPSIGELKPERASCFDIVSAALLLMAFVVVGLLTIEDYGLTWDELENLVVGERYLAFLTSGDVSALDFGQPRRELDNPDGLHFRGLDSQVHPPLPNMLAALTGRILGRWTGWYDPMDARHAAIILMGGLIVAVTYLFAREAFGLLDACVAALALLSFPAFRGATFTIT